MTQLEALRALDRVGVEAFSTRDAGALLKIKAGNASMILARLAQHGFVTRLAHGRWGLSGKLQRLSLPEHIAAPYPAYVSLQTALFERGLIQQVPSMIYAVTLGRTRRVSAPAAAVSLHHLPPELFDGFEGLPAGGHLATAEKALFDVLYLGPARSRLFSHLPELEIPRAFKWPALEGWLGKVVAGPRKLFIRRRLDELRS